MLSLMVLHDRDTVLALQSIPTKNRQKNNNSSEHAGAKSVKLYNGDWTDIQDLNAMHLCTLY